MNINKVFLMGRLTADPELRVSANGNVPVIRFTIAVSRRMKRDETDFIDCVAFRQTAEFISKFFRKGSAIIAFGSIQVDNWKDKEGKNQRSPRVVVDEVMFGESKNASSSSAAAKAPAAAAPEKDQEAYSNIPENDFFADIRDIEEDLPF